MATVTWPSIDASYVSDYGFIGGKEIAVPLQSGGTYSAFLSTTARYRMTLHYNGLRTNKNVTVSGVSKTELKAIEDAALQLKRGDTVTMNDPNGTSRTWTYDGDYVEPRRIPKTTWWEVEIPLRSIP